MADTLSVVESFSNLHDVFMNASVVKRAMDQAPIPDEDAQWHYHDRGRLERLWVALLAVLIEAWHADQMKPAREYLATVTNIDELVRLLREARKTDNFKRLQTNRSYMFHRDEREYWDEGRLGPIGHLDFHVALHSEFSRVLLVGLRSINAPGGDSA